MKSDQIVYLLISLAYFVFVLPIFLGLVIINQSGILDSFARSNESIIQLMNYIGFITITGLNIGYLLMGLGRIKINRLSHCSLVLALIPFVLFLLIPFIPFEQLAFYFALAGAFSPISSMLYALVFWFVAGVFMVMSIRKSK